ncbi:MAG: pitrilysin family protein [Actinomycetota bacterium]|nr:pitrilysin family protein [Actinomycetota bacterium]
MEAAIETTTLGNGLEVVVLPDMSTSVAALAVHYDVGFRSEPPGSSGFAHLFEHLMFQGSEHLDKGELPRLIQGSGGIFNGFTRPDATVYFEQLPAGALELALYCEADRMRAPKITEENLANQIAVVKEEIRANVLNQPYGGFPWLEDLPPLLFETFANSHNGYGSFDDLDAASLDDVRSFFDRYYSPANAVVTIAGAAEPAIAASLVERYFGDIPGRDVPPRPSFAENRFSGERRVERVDTHAPLPALAIGYRVPDPIGDEEHYDATVLMASLLAYGSASRLFDRLVRREKLAADVGAMWGGLDSAWTSRDPTYLSFIVHYPDAGLTERIISCIDDEIDTIAAGVPASALEPVLAQLTSEHWMQIDRKYELAVQAGFFEQQRGRARLTFELADRLAAAATRVSDVAAEWFAPRNRAVCMLVPGGAS